jgi:hypothetical protein
MAIKKVSFELVRIVAGTLAVTAIVTLLWSVVSHGPRSIDWETAFRFALVFGLILPWAGRRRSA